MIRLTVLFLAAVACALHAAVAEDVVQTVPRPLLAIEDVSIVDVIKGEVLPPRTVLIADGRVAAIGESGTVDVPPAAQRVDGRGLYLMPGLVDMHVHLFNNASRRPPNDWAFPLLVANGVTGVREMAAKVENLPTVAAWRRAVAEGRLIAPHVLAAGVVVRGGGSGDPVEQQVRKAQAAGADFVKIFSDMREPEWRRTMQQASRSRIPVCGHVPDDVRLHDAARAGQRSNEHLTRVYEASSAAGERSASRRGRSGRAAPDEHDVLRSFNSAACQRTAAALAAARQVQVPTLVLAHFDARGSRQGLSQDARWPSLRSDEQARWKRILEETPPVDDGLAALRLHVSLAIVRTLHAGGVRILAGTDAPMPFVYPGYALHKELELLVEGGLSNADALRSATIWPAEFLGRSETSGSVAVGKRADLVLLAADPLQQISNTQRIHAVVLDGRWLDPKMLPAMAEPVR